MENNEFDYVNFKKQTGYNKAQIMKNELDNVLKKFYENSVSRLAKDESFANILNSNKELSEESGMLKRYIEWKQAELLVPRKNESVIDELIKNINLSNYKIVLDSFLKDLSNKKNDYYSKIENEDYNKLYE